MLVKFIGCFFPRDLVTSHYINLYLTIMVFQYLESTLHVFSCCYIGQISDKLSGGQEQALLKWYALN